MMGSILDDVRHALRGLRRQPGFAAVAILTLALGIGANTAIFSLMDAVLLRPIQARDPSSLALVRSRAPMGGLAQQFAYPEYLDFKDRSESFDGVAGFATMVATLATEDGGQRLWGHRVSGNFFSVLGDGVAFGRALEPADDTPGAAPAVVIGHRLWRSRFHGDRDVLGRTIELNGKRFTVVGVARRGFEGMMRGFTPDYWIALVPSGSFEDPAMMTSRNMRWLSVVGRLRDGVTPDAAGAELTSIARAAAGERRPDPNAPRVYGPPGAFGPSPVVVAPAPHGQGGLLEDVARVSVLLMAVVALVLIIACANVANLLLARAAWRRREIAIRVALGVARTRLVRQMLVESLLLALFGAVAGWLLAAWAGEALSAFRPPSLLPVELDVRLDLRVFLFTTLVAVAAGIVFGLAPALQATRSDLLSALKSAVGVASLDRPHAAMRRALVVAQVALSVTLLVGAGLFIRSLIQQQRIDLGFDPHNVTAVALDPGRGEGDRASSVLRRVLDRTRALPGVTFAAYTLIVTPSPGGMAMALDSDQLGLPPGETVEMDVNQVGADYFATLRIPIVRGRGFREEETLARGSRAVVVNQSLARRLWPNADPVGRTLTLSPQRPPLEVVGVAGDGRYRGLVDTDRSCLYQPFADVSFGGPTLLIKTAGDVPGLLSQVRGIVAEEDPGFTLYDPRTMEQHVSALLLPARVAALLLAAFGALAALLAALGLYGVLSFAVARRTQEIGVRMALGADRARVLSQFLGEGMSLAGIGLALGVVLALLAGRAVAALLYGVTPHDPLTYAAMALGAGAVTLAACWLPAHRATRVEPVVALRAE